MIALNLDDAVAHRAARSAALFQPARRAPRCPPAGSGKPGDRRHALAGAALGLAADPHARSAFAPPPERPSGRRIPAPHGGNWGTASRCRWSRRFASAMPRIMPVCREARRARAVRHAGKVEWCHEITQKITRPSRSAHVTIGGGAPIVVQSMTNTDTADIEGTVAQVKALARAGLRTGARHGQQRRIGRRRTAHPRAIGCAGRRHAVGRRFPLQRPQAAEGASRLRAGACQAAHQSGQRRPGQQARPAIRRNDRNRLQVLGSRCASA